METTQTATEDTGNQTSALRIISQVVATINATLDLQAVIDTSLAVALNSIGCTEGAIYMWDDRIDALNMVSYKGFEIDHVRAQFSLRKGEGAVGRAADLMEIVSASSSNDGHQHMQYCIPLLTAPNRLLGVLSISTGIPLSDHALLLLEAIAGQMSLAIDKAQLLERVQSHQEELERTVALRTSQLARAIDNLTKSLARAEEADKLKSLLLSTVSHELRTPLATIKGNASLLLDHHEQITKPMLLEIASDIEYESDKLTELISNLLEMSRIESGSLKIDRRVVDISEVINTAVKAAQRRITDHPIRLEKAPHLMCYGDTRRIEQIAANLIDNAAKYSPAGRPIQVDVSQRAGYAQVAIIDQGKGIELEYQDRIFLRFYQASSKPDSQRKGIGLGLSICRGLVEAHEGQIWIDSQPGKGSTFYFTIPLISSQSSEVSDGR